jgi:hypothetical protein
MIRPVERDVVVQKGGRIELRVPGLKPGTRAKVTVVEEQPKRRRRVRWSSLIGSCKGMFKSPAEADKFLNEERDSWER